MDMNSKDSGFVHLRVRSEHSVGASVLKVDEIVKRAEQLGMRAVGLADVETLCGAFGFWRQAVARRMRPIFGCELPVAGGRVVFFARNRDGWRALVGLVTHVGSGKALDEAEIAARSADLVAVDCPGSGVVARAFEAGGRDAAIREAVALKRAMPRGCFFLGVGSAGRSGPSALDFEMRHVARAVDAKTVMAIPVGQSDELVCAAELRAAFPGYEDAIESTVCVAELCAEPFSIHGPLDAFPSPRDADPAAAEERLSRLANDGLAARLEQIRRAGASPDESAYRARLGGELDSVRGRRFVTNFLFAADVAALCRRRGVIRGPGPFTMASSLLLFALGVTDIDPVAHGLCVESFLNPDRMTLPEIVFEVEAGRASEVLAQVAEQFAEGTAMQPTVVVCDPESKLVERRVASPTKLAVCGSGVFPRMAVVRDVAAIGSARADVLEEDMTMFGFWECEVVPDELLADLRRVCREDGLPDEEAPDLARIPLDDDATWRSIASGRAEILTSPRLERLREIAPELRPGDIPHLAAAFALNLGARGKDERREPRVTTHSAMAPLIAETYGALLYREQIMALFQNLTGCSLARADILRRAFSIGKHCDDVRREILQNATARGFDGGAVDALLSSLGRDLVRSLIPKGRALAWATRIYWCAWMEGTLGQGPT